MRVNISYVNNILLQAQIRVIPAARVISVGESTPVPWWVIFVPIMAAVIVITIVAILLWVVSAIELQLQYIYIWTLWSLLEVDTVA